MVADVKCNGMVSGIFFYPGARIGQEFFACVNPIAGFASLFNLFAFRRFVDEFVEVANLLHQRAFDVFHADAANGAFDQRGV